MKLSTPLESTNHSQIHDDQHDHGHGHGEIKTSGNSKLVAKYRSTTRNKLNDDEQGLEKKENSDDDNENDKIKKRTLKIEYPYAGYEPITNIKSLEQFWPQLDNQVISLASTHIIFLKCSTFAELAKKICPPFFGNLAMVRLIYSFVISIDLLGILQKILAEPTPDSPLEFLWLIYEKKCSWADFFARICHQTGVPVKIISGIAKNSNYSTGNRLNIKMLASRWNAVLINDSWQLLDVIWASKAKKTEQEKNWQLIYFNGELIFDQKTLREMQQCTDRINTSTELTNDDTNNKLNANFSKSQRFNNSVLKTKNNSFFLTPPYQFLNTHFPCMQCWQLIQNPITLSDFSSRAYIRERYYQMRLYSKSATNGLLQADEGELTITYEFPMDLNAATNYEFSWLLYYFKGTYKPEDDDVITFHKKTRKNFVLHLMIGTVGLYKWDLYGMDKRTHKSMELLISHFIHCTKPSSRVEPLCEIPLAGWGRGINADLAGIRHGLQDSSIMSMDNGFTTIFTGLSGIRKKEDGNNNLLTNTTKKLETFCARIQLRSDTINARDLCKYGYCAFSRDQFQCVVRLPCRGEYVFKMFIGQAHCNRPMNNACNYLMQCERPQVGWLPYPDMYPLVLGAEYRKCVYNIKPLELRGILKSEENLLSLKFLHDSKVKLCVEITYNRAFYQDIDILKVDCVSATETIFVIKCEYDDEIAANIFAYKEKNYQLRHVISYLLLPFHVKQIDETSVGAIENLPSRLAYCRIDTCKDNLQIECPLSSQNDKEYVLEIHKENVYNPSFNYQIALKLVTINNNNLTRRRFLKLFNVQLPDIGTYFVDIYAKRSANIVEKIKMFLVNRCNEVDIENIDESLALLTTELAPIYERYSDIYGQSSSNVYGKMRSSGNNDNNRLSVKNTKDHHGYINMNEPNNYFKSLMSDKGHLNFSKTIRSDAFLNNVLNYRGENSKNWLTTFKYNSISEMKTFSTKMEDRSLHIGPYAKSYRIIKTAILERQLEDALQKSNGEQLSILIKRVRQMKAVSSIGGEEVLKRYEKFTEEFLRLDMARKRLARLNITDMLDFLEEYPPTKLIYVIFKCVLVVLKVNDDDLSMHLNASNLDMKNDWPQIYIFLQLTRLCHLKKKMLACNTRQAVDDEVRVGCYEMLKGFKHEHFLGMNLAGKVIFNWIVSIISLTDQKTVVDDHDHDEQQQQQQQHNNEQYGFLKKFNYS